MSRAVSDLTGPALAQLDGIADRLAGRVAAESNQRVCHSMITDEIVATRQAVADIASALLARFEGAK